MSWRQAVREGYRESRWLLWFNLYFLPVCALAVLIDVWVNGWQSEPSWVAYAVAILAGFGCLWLAHRTVEWRAKR